jgi:hypothetical protein
LNLFYFVLELEILLGVLVEPGAALAYHAGDDFFQLIPDGATFTEECSSTQLISLLQPLVVVVNNVGRLLHDPVFVYLEVGVVEFDRSFAGDLLRYLLDLHGLR